MKRLLGGLAGVVGLLALLVGVPVLLVAIAGNPLPGAVPGWAEIRRTVVQGDFNTGLLISVVATLGWLLWLLAVWSVVWEFSVNMPRVLRGQALRSGPAIPAPLGRLAAALMIGVVALVTPMKGTARAEPLPEPAAAAPAHVVAPAEKQVPVAASPKVAVAPTWAVEKGDTLWDIAVVTLGDGGRVDEIVRLNPDVSAAAVLSVGTVLELPADATIDASRAAPVAAGDDDHDGVEVVVERGDTLWDLTQEVTGDVDMPTIERVADANSIENPDLIFPDQVISFETVVPAERADVVPTSERTGGPSEVVSAAATEVSIGDESPAEQPTVSSSVDSRDDVEPSQPVEQSPVSTDAGLPAPIGVTSDTTLPPPTVVAATVPDETLVPEVTQRAMFPSLRWMVGGGAIGSLALAGAWKILHMRRQRRRMWMQVQDAPEQEPTEREDVRRVLTRAQLTTALMGADGAVLTGSRGLVVGDDEVEVLRRDDAPPPQGWERSDAGWMAARPVLAAPMVSGAVATVGVDDEGTEVLIDVLASEAVAVTGDRAAVEALLCAMVFELAASSDVKLVMAGLSCLAAAETPARVEMIDVDDAAELMRSRDATDEPMVLIIDPFAEGSVGVVQQLRTAASQHTALVWAGPLPDAVETIEVPNEQVVRWAGFELAPMGLSEDHDRELSVVLDAVSVGKASTSTHRDRPFDPEAAAVLAREANELTAEGSSVAVLARGGDDDGREPDDDLGVSRDLGLPVNTGGVAEPFVSSVEQPRVLVRACASKITAIGASLGDSQVEAAAVFVLATAGKPVASMQLAERVECSPKTLANVISTEHGLVIREDGELRLHDGVVTDYEWCRRTAQGLAEAIMSDDEDAHREWLQLADEALRSVELAPFSTVPTNKRSGRVWQWVDEWPEGCPARWGAESDIAQAALGFATVWPVVDGDRWITRDGVVAQLCRLAGIVPNAVVRPVGDSSWANSGEALLEAAMSVASDDHGLVRVVHNAARVMVSRHQIEASDELAEQLGL